MGTIKNILDSLAARNAVQQFKKDGFNSTNFYTRDIDYNNLFAHVNIAGKYDNFYGDSNKIVTTASSLPFYYIDKNNDIVDEDKNAFAYHLKYPNSSFPQRKVLAQIYTELITHGHSDLFLWRKDGKNETSIFQNGKKYDELTFGGITLVSGYDKSTLTKTDLDNIVRINYGVSQANVFMGYSPSQAAQSWRKMQDEMGLHMTEFAKNAGIPIGTFIITAPDPEQYEKMRNKLDGKINGARNNGKVLFSYKPTDSKISQIEWVQFGSRDIQKYTDQLNFAEKKISQDFGVPGTVKGTNDDASYATARVAEQIFMKYTIKPIAEDLKDQLEFFLTQRFNLTGKIKCDVPIPELADESLVKIQATTQQVTLYDQKIAEGYTPESIVAAYALPERFLLLEKDDSQSTSSQNSPMSHNKNAEKHTCNCPKCVKNDMKTDDLAYARHYQNEFTEEQRKDIEEKFVKICEDYAYEVLKNGISDEAIEDYEGKMSVEFLNQYQKLYDSNLDSISDSLAEILGTIDVASLHLTDEELQEAIDQYNTRVKDFSRSFAEQIDKLEGETLEVRNTKAQPHVKMVTVTESEHTRIVSELKGWTKAQEEFPVRVWKTWHTQEDSRVCENCQELDGTSIDVTSQFIGNETNEIYETVGGGLHPNCRCFCKYEMEKDDDRD